MMQSKIAWHWKQDFWNDYYVKHPLLLLLLMVYTIFGAMVFVTLERPKQEDMELRWHNDVALFRLNSVKKLTTSLFNTSDLLIFLDPNRFQVAQEILEKSVISFESEFLNLYEHRDKRTLQWDMWNASVFAMSAFTTIGYKNLYPITMEGRIALILYSLIGVPLLLSVLTNVTLMMHHLLKLLWNKIFLLNKYAKQGYLIEIPVLFAISSVVVWIFASSSSCLLWKRNEWDVLDAFYFFFLSFSTIGLVGIDEMHPAFYFVVWVYVIVALALVSVCFKLMQSKPKRHQSLATDRQRESISSKWFSEWKETLSVSEYEKTFDKRSFKSFVSSEYPDQAKLLYSSENPIFKSLDNVNMLMEAYKEELLWLVHSGRYSSEEQSVIDMNMPEEIHDEIRDERRCTISSSKINDW